MNEEENREERPEEGKTESSPEVNDTSGEQPVESTANYQTQTENMEVHHFYPRPCLSSKAEA